MSRRQITESDSELARLDVTGDVCPITWVKTKLALDELEAHSVLRVHLNSGEAFADLPRSAKDEGHKVLEVSDNRDGTYDVWIEKEGLK